MSIHVEIAGRCDQANYKLHAVIGKACGGLADVYLASSGSDDTISAMPSLQAVRVCELERFSEEELCELLHEMRALNNLRHPNVISATFSLWDHSLHFVMPLSRLGSVTDVISARFIFGLSEAACAFILRDVLTALQYLSEKCNLVHRGVRCSHILLDPENNRAILCGFRSCVSLVSKGHRSLRLHAYTPDLQTNVFWLAPEVLQQNLVGYSCKSDVYSLGITACEMANGFPPFSDMEKMQMLLEKLRGTTPRLLDSTTCPPPANDSESSTPPSDHERRTFTEAFHFFTEQCLRHDVQGRPTASELLHSSAFIKQSRKSKHSLSQLLQPFAPLDLARFRTAQCQSEQQQSADELQQGTSDMPVNWNF